MRTYLLLFPLLSFLFPALHFLPCYKLLYHHQGLPGKSWQHSFKRPLPVQRYNLIITEIMADPSPLVALPEHEYIEIRNNAPVSIDLKGCSLGDESSTATFTNSIILPPDSFLICCSNAAAPKYLPFGRTVGLSNFPSLGNESDLVLLRSPDNRVIHAIHYESSWFRNPLKANGGWSLEMIDFRSPCAGSVNWAASTAVAGGTPGQANSQPPGIVNNQPPSLLHAYPIDDTRIIAVLDEPLDSNSAVQPKNYSLQPSGSHPLSCLTLPPFFKEVQLQFQQPLIRNAIYQLVVSDLKGCEGSASGISNTAKVGLPSPVQPGDIIMNEILFDPPSDGADYVELFNRSNRVIDLQQLYCSNRDASRQLANMKVISNKPFLLFPGEYLAQSEKPDWVSNKYAIHNSHALHHAVLPVLPNDKGSLVLSNAAGEVLDELQYEASWHFSLLTNAEGISLERISPYLPTQDKHNWLSASSTAGGGTPGYQNSQFRWNDEEKSGFQLSPTIFSPDLDGREDCLLIRYNMPSAGAIGTVRIFNIEGKPVRQLAANALMGISGQWSWDGLSESRQPLAAGIYIVQVSWFNAQGVTRRWKQGVALVRRR